MVLRNSTRISLLIDYQKTAVVRVFTKAKAKGNFAGENITDADVKRKSIWISVCETDHSLFPKQLSQASAIENCVTLSASLRRHVDNRSNRGKIDSARAIDRSLPRAIVTNGTRLFKWTLSETNSTVFVMLTHYSKPSREIFHSSFRMIWSNGYIVK